MKNELWGELRKKAKYTLKKAVFCNASLSLMFLLFFPSFVGGEQQSWEIVRKDGTTLHITNLSFSTPTQLFYQETNGDIGFIPVKDLKALLKVKTILNVINYSPEKRDALYSKGMKLLNEEVDKRRDTFVEAVLQQQQKDEERYGKGQKGDIVRIRPGALLCNFFTIEKAITLHDKGDYASIKMFIKNEDCTVAPKDFFAIITNILQTEPPIGEITLKGISAWAATRDMECCFE